MKDKKRERRGKVSRREFLKAGVAGLGMAAMGGLTEKAFGAPAVIKGTKLTILQGTYFIAPGQDLYKKQAQEWGAGQRRHDECGLPELARSAAEDRCSHSGRRRGHRRAVAGLELSL